MNLHKDDYGCILRLLVVDSDGDAVNLKETESTYILLYKPDDTSLTKDATFTTDGSDGKIQYTVKEKVLDIVGTWSIQGYIVFKEKRLLRKIW